MLNAMHALFASELTDLIPEDEKWQLFTALTLGGELENQIEHPKLREPLSEKTFPYQRLTHKKKKENKKALNLAVSRPNEEYC